MKKLLTIILLSAFFAACGGGASKLEIKTSGGKDASFEVKSSTADRSVMTYTEAPRGDGIVRSKVGTSYTLYFANFEITPADIMKTREVKEGQTIVFLAFVGEEGTKENEPFKVATYSTKNEKFNRLNSASIYTFADGKSKNDSFDLMSSMSKAEGELKITGVTADAVSGEINLTEGDKSIKGTFTAKLPAKK